MNQERLLQVILSPHVSEKAARAAEGDNAYAFKVSKDASKPEIRAAVEMLFEVSVVDVRTVNVKAKASALLAECRVVRTGKRPMCASPMASP